MKMKRLFTQKYRKITDPDPDHDEMELTVHLVLTGITEAQILLKSLEIVLNKTQREGLKRECEEIITKLEYYSKFKNPTKPQINEMTRLISHQRRLKIEGSRLIDAAHEVARESRKQ